MRWKVWGGNTRGPGASRRFQSRGVRLNGQRRSSGRVPGVRASICSNLGRTIRARQGDTDCDQTPLPANRSLKRSNKRYRKGEP
jgi:hypothetical protein